MKKTNYKIIIRMLPNLVTMLRMILTMVIIWLCHDGLSNFYAILNISILVFLTDILDGILARKLHSETKTGEIMDVIADMGYIFSMSVIMSKENIISGYFLILVCTEFVVFICTSKFLRDEKRYLIFDMAGRILAAIYYVTPIVMYITFFNSSTLHLILYKYGFKTLVLFTFAVVIYRISLCKVNVKQLIKD